MTCLIRGVTLHYFFEDDDRKFYSDNDGDGKDLHFFHNGEKIPYYRTVNYPHSHGLIFPQCVIDGSENLYPHNTALR